MSASRPHPSRRGEAAAPQDEGIAPVMAQQDWPTLQSDILGDNELDMRHLPGPHIAPEVCVFLEPSGRTEGAGKTGRWPLPWPACSKKSRRQSPQVWPGRPALPARWLYGFLRALPGVRDLLVTVAGRSSPASLAPAQGCQDHTPSPYASVSLVQRPGASIASRIPRFVTIAKRPSCERGTPEENQKFPKKGSEILRSRRRQAAPIESLDEIRFRSGAFSGAEAPRRGPILPRQANQCCRSRAARSLCVNTRGVASGAPVFS